MAKSTTVTLSTVVNTIANKRDRDATKVGKSVRAYIRSHNADLVKMGWTSLRDHGKGDSYRPMPRKVAQHIVKTLS